MQVFNAIQWQRAAACLALAVVLGGCASGPRTAAGGSSLTRSSSARHLDRVSDDRVIVAPVPADQDDMTELLAGEFALDNNDLTAAAHHYARAAQISADAGVAAQATRIAIANKSWDQVRAGLLRWQALSSKSDAGVWQAQAMLAMHDAQPDQAFDDLQHLAHEPQGRGWTMIAQALLADDDHAQAGALLERLARPDLLGDSTQTWIALSQLAGRLQRKPLEESLANQAALKFRSADTYAWAAQIKLNAGDKTGARTMFADAVAHDAKNTHLRVAYATLLGEIGDNSAAAHVLSSGPQDDFTYGARAAYAARTEDKALIEPLYKEIKALPTPRSPAHLNLLGQLAELLEHKSEALAWYVQVPEDDEHAFDSQMRSAVLLDQTDRSEDASNLLHALQARSGDDAKQLGESYLLEGELLDRHQKGELAIETYNRGLEALPDDTRLIYARALQNEELGHVDAAVSDLRGVLALQPNDANAMNALGYTLADRTDRHDEALTLIQNALTLKPGEPAIIDSLGWVHYRMGHLDAAIEDLKSAYQKQPDAEIAAHLGEVLWVSGKKDEARKIFEQGRTKDAKNKTLLETTRRLGA